MTDETKPHPATKAAAISVPSNVLEAVAKWAGTDDARSHLRQVHFTKGTMVALDGHRMVIAPCETYGMTLGVDRKYLLAAVAAQRSMKIDHGDVLIAPVPVDPALKAFSSALLRLTVDPAPPAVAFIVPAADTSMFPAYQAVADANSQAESMSPEGYGLNPQFLADIAEVTAATCYPGMRGVKVIAWSRDRLGAMVFENTAGVKFFVMPMRL